MAKLPRKTQKVFGSTASSNQIAKFGSLAAGSPVRYDGASADPANVQALSNYLTGWYGAVTGGNSPAIEDMNALHYLFAYQLAYGFQAGVPEYDSATTYYIGSVVNDGVGGLYISLTDTNVGNAVTDTTKWRAVAAAVVNALVTGTATPYAAVAGTSFETEIFWSTGGVDKVVTLPTAVGIPGKQFFIKKTDSGAGKITVNTTSSQTMDGDTSLSLRLQYDFINIISDGANWVVKSMCVSAETTATVSNWNASPPSVTVVSKRRAGRICEIYLKLTLFTVAKMNTSTVTLQSPIPAEFRPANLKCVSLLTGSYNTVAAMLPSGQVDTDGSVYWTRSPPADWSSGNTAYLWASGGSYMLD